jgi:hypothetical protein
MPAVKNVGEPCAGKPHARFDGGREETNVSRPCRATPGASRLPDITSPTASNVGAEPSEIPSEDGSTEVRCLHWQRVTSVVRGQVV